MSGAVTTSSLAQEARHSAKPNSGWMTNLILGLHSPKASKTKNKRRSPVVSAAALPKPAECLTCTQATEIKGEMAMGVFWSADVYEEHFQKYLPKKLRKPHHWQRKTLWVIALEDDVDDGEPKADLAMKGNQVLKKLNDAYQKMETLVKFLHDFGKTQTDLSGNPEQLNCVMEQCKEIGIELPPYSVLLAPEQ